jgi:thiol peroxidase
MFERKGITKFAGIAVTIVGADIQVGQTAPEFTAQKQDWSLTNVLEETSGKVRILTALPSLNTPVCDRETRRFNEAASQISADIEIVAVSTDLPILQGQWCGGAGIDRVHVVSDHLETDFGIKYGCLMKELRILRRAVFVVDRNNTVTYAAYMPTAGHEPEYDEVLAAAEAALV